MKKIIVTALSFVIAMGFVLMAPQDASADAGYTVTFTAEGDHDLSAEGGYLKIDGIFVDLKNGDQTIGTVNVAGDKSATITVDDGQAGKLNYNAAGRFDLFSGDQPFGTDTEISNVHDGETFEIIPVESYDPATNTITFRTKSFSNYAIAVKDSRKGGSKGPGTGDDNSIIPDLVIMITAGLALAGIGLKRRYDR